MTEHYYGEAPEDLGPLDLPDWHEFMHYLYLPVRIPGRDPGFQRSRTTDRYPHRYECVLPPNLRFLRPAIATVVDSVADGRAPHLVDPYVYVTARRGFATPGNPLNRPGWHCDDFGGTDLNYIWADRWPTRFLLSDDPLYISADDAESMDDMRLYANSARVFAAPGGRRALHGERIEEAPGGHLLRLSPYVIHDTPLIPEPGGMRSFFKISVSSHRYNLLGNSHNHLLDYDWPMYDRAEVRNQPGGNGDYVREPVNVHPEH